MNPYINKTCGQFIIKLTGVIFLLLITKDLSAQNKLYLRPVMGLGFPQAVFEKKTSRPDFIKGTDKFSFFGVPGLGILFDLNRKISFELSTEISGIGHGLKAFSHSDSAQSPTRVATNSSYITRKTLFRCYLNSKKIIIGRGDHFFSNLIDPNHKRAILTMFDIEIFFGISYEFILPYIEGELSINPSPPVNGVIINDLIQLEETTTLINRRGWGLQIGAQMQFYNWRGHRALQIGLMYHKGMNKRFVVTWQTAVNGTRYPDFNTITRGSMMALYAAYPIRLITFGKGKNG